MILSLVLSVQSNSGQAAAGQSDAGPAQSANMPAELLDTKYLFEVVRHVYRWYIDENDVDRLAGAVDFPIWVRMLDVPKDKDDKSQMAEITMPLIGVMAKVKKADYRIDELNITVTSSTFRVTSVSKIGIPEKPLPEHRVINVKYAEMKDYLFRTRSEATFPEGQLFERLRVALRKEMGLKPEERTAGRHIVHLAPLSPAANEVFVFLESHKLLVRFASDIDLSNPAMWEHESLMVKTWDVTTQVVVSLDEAAGSNAFMTRDQIGRALFNCIVLGRRLEITNPGDVQKTDLKN
jgi:hypothetical protein